MRRRHAFRIALATVLGALAIAALPALAGARDDHHDRGHDRAEHRHHHGQGDHGQRDRHENVGKISAFDAGSGELTIARFRGGTISGLVTSSTEIECEGRDDFHASTSRDRDEDSGPGRGDDDDNGVDDNDDRTCTTAQLTVGTVVHEVDRDFHDGVATFDELEIAHSR